MEDQIRQAIIAAINSGYPTAFPAVPIVYPNAPFDWNTLPEQFTEVEIEFQGGSQVGMAWAPKRRVAGCVYVHAYRRAGTGVKGALDVVTWFSDTLKFQHLGPAQLQAPEPDGNSQLRGFHIEHLKVPFCSDPA